MGSKKQRNPEGRRPAHEARAPTFHPVEALPGIAMLIDGQAHDAEQLWRSLARTRREPWLLDDEIVERTFRLYSESLDDAWVFEEQLERWLEEEGLSPDQRAEAERLQGQMARFRELAGNLVDLAKEARGKTIDAILRMSDEEAGLAVLSGRLPLLSEGGAREPEPDPLPERPLRLPEEVTCSSERDPQGRLLLHLRHRTLGYLGHLECTDLPGGMGMEVKALSPDQPLETRATRQALFGPLALEIIQHLQRQGEGLAGRPGE